MAGRHRVVVALSSSEDERTLIPFAEALSSWHASSPCVVVKRNPRPAAEAGGAVAVENLDARVIVTTPQSVECVKISAPGQLMDVATDGETDAVLVGESIGRSRVQTLLRRARCSVWFVPEEAAPLVRRILVPVDFSVRAADCVRVATAIATFNAPANCTALHIYFNESVFADGTCDQRRRAELAQAWHKFHNPIHTLNVAVAPVFLQAADSSRAITNFADNGDIDLIVMSTRGRTWTGGMLYPSLTEQVLRQCRVPLLAVKHFGARRGLFGVLAEHGTRRSNMLRFN
jgi:nucleotide-binding universal stress UspA family protein